MVFDLQCGDCDGPSKKLTWPTAWITPAAQTIYFPFSRGEGRFLAKTPRAWWINWRYSSLRCFLLKASVSAVIAENLSSRAFGTFTDVGMVQFLKYLKCHYRVMDIIAQSLLLHTSHSVNSFTWLFTYHRLSNSNFRWIPITSHKIRPFVSRPIYFWAVNDTITCNLYIAM